MAHVEIEEELDVEIQEDKPPFLAGQMKWTLDLSPVKIVKAPDSSLNNRAALAGASLAKERHKLRQQEANKEVDSQAWDFSQLWLNPMLKEADKIFAQDLRGNLKGQKAEEVPSLVSIKQWHSVKWQVSVSRINGKACPFTSFESCYSRPLKRWVSNLFLKCGLS